MNSSQQKHPNPSQKQQQQQHMFGSLPKQRENSSHLMDRPRQQRNEQDFQNDKASQNKDSYFTSSNQRSYAAANDDGQQYQREEEEEGFSSSGYQQNHPLEAKNQRQQRPEENDAVYQAEKGRSGDPHIQSNQAYRNQHTLNVNRGVIGGGGAVNGVTATRQKTVFQRKETQHANKSFISKKSENPMNKQSSMMNKSDNTIGEQPSIASESFLRDEVFKSHNLANCAMRYSKGINQKNRQQNILMPNGQQHARSEAPLGINLNEVVISTTNQEGMDSQMANNQPRADEIPESIYSTFNPLIQDKGQTDISRLMQCEEVNRFFFDEACLVTKKIQRNRDQNQHFQEDPQHQQREMDYQMNEEGEEGEQCDNQITTQYHQNGGGFAINRCFEAENNQQTTQINGAGGIICSKPDESRIEPIMGSGISDSKMKLPQITSRSNISAQLSIPAIQQQNNNLNIVQHAAFLQKQSSENHFKRSNLSSQNYSQVRSNIAPVPSQNIHLSNMLAPAVTSDVHSKNKNEVSFQNNGSSKEDNQNHNFFFNQLRSENNAIMATASVFNPQRSQINAASGLGSNYKALHSQQQSAAPHFLNVVTSPFDHVPQFYQAAMDVISHHSNRRAPNMKELKHGLTQIDSYGLNALVSGIAQDSGQHELGSRSKEKYLSQNRVFSHQRSFQIEEEIHQENIQLNQDIINLAKHNDESDLPITQGYERFETPQSGRQRDADVLSQGNFPDNGNKREEPVGMNIVIHEDEKKAVNTLSESIRALQSQYEHRALYLFPINSWFRRLIIKIVDSRNFEYLIILVISLNSLGLAMYDYKDRDSDGRVNQIIDQANLIFTGIFIGEGVLKIIAKGLLFHQESYLRNGWNIIDTIVIISGILELSFGSVKLKALRVVRVFRPLKSINVIPNMKKLIQALIQSLPDFANVGTFLLYVFVLFATMGVHQYNGSLYNMCRYEKDPFSNETWPYDPNYMRVCSQSELGLFICPNGLYCGNHDENQGLAIASDDLEKRNYINYGITNFDNIGTSLLSVFQIINSDTWYQQLENLMDVDIPILGAMYCVLMIVVGQFFLMNLILAVIIFSFIKTQKHELEHEIKALKDSDTQHNEHQHSNGGQGPLGFNSTFNQSHTAANVQGSDNHPTIGNVPHLPGASGLGADIDENTFSMNVQTRSANFRENDALQASVSGVPGHSASQKKNNHLNEEDADADFATFLKPHAQKKKYANILMKKGVDNGQSPDLLRDGDLNASRDENPTTALFKQSTIHHKNTRRLEEADDLMDLNSGATSSFRRGNKNSPGNQTSQEINFGGIKRAFTSKHHGNQSPKILSKVVKSENYEENGTGNGTSLKDNLESVVQSVPPANNPMVLALGKGIQGGKLAPGNLFSKKTVTEHEPSSPSGNDQNQMSRIFKRYIKKKIEYEYEIYFKKLLAEAKQNYNCSRHEQYADKANLREIVGLKVGLEFIKQHEVAKELENELNIIESRMKQNRLYNAMYVVQESRSFNFIMAISIILNTIALALDKYPVDLQKTQILEKVNIVFTIIFLIEMIIKMLALGIKSYFKGSAFNIFDMVIVLASIIDLFMANIVLAGGSDSGSVITALRGFRLLRIFKLAKQWKRFELLLETLGRTLQDIATFSILLFLFIFVFSLLGLELFAQRAKFNLKLDLVDLENGQSPRYNFDTFLNSFTTVFIVLTNDSEAQIYYDHYRTAGPVASTLFFIMLVIFGQKILLNLFLAILLENFDESALKHKMHEYEDNQMAKDKENSGILEKNQWQQFQLQAWNYWYRFVDCIKRKSARGSSDSFDDSPKSVNINPRDRKKIMKNLKMMSKGGVVRGLSSQLMMNDQIVLQGVSLNVIPIDNWFRKLLFNIVTHRKFDYAISLIIVLSAVQLALDSPIKDPESSLKKSLFWIDLGTTIIFILEAIIKIIAFGFATNGKSSYLRNPWNSLDFLIIFFSVLALTPLSDSLKTFKIFRILRLLRLISRNEELKVAVRALFLAIPNVANVTIIMILFFIIFGVIAVSYFKGKLYNCFHGMEELESQIDTKWDCLSAGGEWTNSVYNFDNSANALVTLFVLSTTAGWADVMLKCATSRDIDYIAGPRESASPLWIFYFILFIIVGSFFFINLFVGVVISTFNSEHDKLGGNDLLTEKQKEWIDLKLLVLRSSPMMKLQKPDSKMKKFFFAIQDSPIFEKIVLFCIVMNTIVLLFKWYEQPPIIDQIAEYINYIFTAIFVFEAVVKIIAYEPKVYFSEGWNIFDFIIILGSFVSIFISANTSLEIRGAITILRSFRILRLLRLIKRGKSLQLIFNTFVITLHSLANIGALLLLFIFMYSILGMIIFGQVKHYGVMDDYINFENFVNSFITLFIVATGDTWNDIMIAFAIDNSPQYQCVSNPNYQDYAEGGYRTNGCGNQTMAYAYFVSYMFVVNLVFLKIFIAIILQGYNDTQTQDGRLFNHDMNDKFREVWTEFDPAATTFIKLSQLRDFLFKLGAPLGFDDSFLGRKFMQDQFIASLELPTYHNFTSYQYLDVLDALSFRLMVLDHITKNYKQFNGIGGGDNSNLLNSQNNGVNNNGGGMIDKDQEREIKDALQKEINKLIFQKQSENIAAVKEVSEKERSRVKSKKANQDKVLTSSHHMAAEATIRKFKQFIKVRRQMSGPSVELSDGGDGSMRNRELGVAMPEGDVGQEDNCNQLQGGIGRIKRGYVLKGSKIITPSVSNANMDDERSRDPHHIDSELPRQGTVVHLDHRRAILNSMSVPNGGELLFPLRQSDTTKHNRKNAPQNQLVNSDNRSLTQNIIKKKLSFRQGQQNIGNGQLNIQSLQICQSSQEEELNNDQAKSSGDDQRENDENDNDGVESAKQEEDEECSPENQFDQQLYPNAADAGSQHNRDTYIKDMLSPNNSSSRHLVNNESFRKLF